MKTGRPSVMRTVHSTAAGVICLRLRLWNPVGADPAVPAGEKYLSLDARIVDPWRQGTITREQVQFYALRLFCQAVARIRRSATEWLPAIPKSAK